MAPAIAALAIAFPLSTPPARANDPCSVSGATLTCTGDQSDGIITSNPPYDTVNVNSLNQPIAPMFGGSGIIVQSDGGAIALNSDAGIHGISTSGNGSPGIRLQTIFSDYAFNAVSSLGAASVTSVGLISTGGSNAHGIHAYGNSFASGSISSTAYGPKITVNSDDVTTLGDGARGILAESMTASIANSLSEAHGDTLSVTSNGTISTAGENAHGIQAFAETYANGFGNGTLVSGSNVAVAASDIATAGDNAFGIYATSSASSGFIGSGSSSVTSGDISVTATGTISTKSENANGIGTEASTSTTTFGVGTAVATGGKTAVTSRDVATLGNGAYGISVRDNVSSEIIGTGSSETHGGDVSVATNGAVSTEGSSAYGIFVAGNASAKASTSNGIDATSGGGKVEITSEDVATLGDFASAIVINSSASSEAEGSGSSVTTGGDVNVASNGTLTTKGFGASAINAFTDATARTVSSSGLGATATGGDVTVTSEDISTQSESAHGVLAQTFAASSTLGTGDAVTTGGDVNVTSNGNISANGYSASGIFAGSRNTSQSDGPGSSQTLGGALSVINNGTVKSAGKETASILLSSYVIASSSSIGNASAISGPLTVTSKNVEAAGINSFGIYAESSSQAYASGPGSAMSRSADVTINSIGTVSASNSGSIGIFALSSATGSGTAISGDIAVNVLSGSVTGGSVGIYILNGTNNVVSNAGTISAISGSAIEGGSGSEAINNSGLILGNVDLGGGSNAFNNGTGGTYASGSLAMLGAGNTLTNNGTLTPGGSGVIQTTVLTGDLRQTASGTYKVDADWATSTADIVTVTGTAQLAGTVVAVPANFPLTAGLAQHFLILHANAGAIDDGIAALDTAAVNYEVIFDPNGLDVYLGATINFLGVGTGGLSPNGSAIAQNINAIQAGGGAPGFAPVANALMTLPTQDALANALDQLSPEIYNYAKIETLFAAEQFSADLMSCRVADGTGASFIREGQCVWARGRARFLDLDTTADNTGADASIGSFSGGAQMALGNDWKLGFAVGYDNASIDTGTGASLDGDRANVGAVIKYNPGPLLLAGAVSGGWSFSDAQRTMAFGGLSGTAGAETDVDYVSGRLHAAYLIEQNGWYLKPLVDGTVTRVETDDLNEKGSPAALVVSGSHDTILSVSPAIEVGSEFNLGSLSVLRPFLRAGLTWRDSDELGLAARFAEAPVAAGYFSINTAIDKVLADVSAGFDLINQDGAALRLQYDGRFGEDTVQNSASIKGSVPF